MVVLWFLFACGVAAAEAWIAVRIYLEYGNVGLFAMFLANMTLVPILSDVIKAWRGNRRGY